MSANDDYDKIKKDFPQLLKKSMGIVSTACDAANVSRNWYYDQRKKDAGFAEACDEVTEYTGDFVETSLLKKIKEGDTSCIIFYCKTKLKNRGYVERVESTGKDGTPISQVSYNVEIAKARIKEIVEAS